MLAAIRIFSSSESPFPATDFQVQGAFRKCFPYFLHRHPSLSARNDLNLQRPILGGLGLLDIYLGSTPGPSNRHYQDYYIFGRQSLYTFMCGWNPQWE